MNDTNDSGSVTIFDWDDTLCPSSWLAVQGKLPKTRAPASAADLSSSELLDLTKLGRQVCQILEEATTIGPVFIVTAAERGWVELSSRLYLPNVLELLNHDDIHVVSARTYYEKKYGKAEPSGAIEWKNEVVQIIARECFTGENASLMNPTECSFHLISIGDGVSERLACISAAADIPFTLSKTVKFIEKPHISDVRKQLELTLRSFSHLANAKTHLDLCLSRAQLEMLDASST